MKVIIPVIFSLWLFGCTAVPHDNQGIKTGDIGLHNEIPVATTAGRDISPTLSFVGGNIGLTLIGLALCGVIYKAVSRR